MTNEQIRRELRRSACEDANPWATVWDGAALAGNCRCYKIVVDDWLNVITIKPSTTQE